LLLLFAGEIVEVEQFASTSTVNHY